MTWQPAATIAADAELWAIDYLRGVLMHRPEHYADAFVSNRVPSARRPRMVIVRRDGGPTEALRDIARVNVRCWADDEADAVDGFLLVAALLRAAPNGNPVLRVEQLSGGIPVPDESGAHIRMGVFEIHTRTEELT